MLERTTYWYLHKTKPIDINWKQVSSNSDNASESTYRYKSCIPKCWVVVSKV